MSVNSLRIIATIQKHSQNIIFKVKDCKEFITNLRKKLHEFGESKIYSIQCDIHEYISILLVIGVKITKIFCTLFKKSERQFVYPCSSQRRTNGIFSSVLFQKKDERISLGSFFFVFVLLTPLRLALSIIRDNRFCKSYGAVRRLQY